MSLDPVPPGARLPLADEDAAPPPGVPEGKKQLVKETKALVKRIEELQRALYAENTRALLVVLQGRDAAGKDGTLRRVFGPIDPQGCRVTSFKRPTPLELSHDYLWRIHVAAPPRGVIGLFNRSHYEDVLVVRVHGLVPEPVWQQRYDQINAFERMLTENGTTVLKFFLHISREEQAERLRARLANPAKNWKFDEGDLGERKRWDAYTEAYRDALARCSTPHAPWFVVPADHKRTRNYLVASTVAAMLDRMAPKYPRADPAVLGLAKEIA